MKNKSVWGFATALLFAVLIVSCKKEDKEGLDSGTSQFINDANYYKGESDQADNDINNTLSDIPGFGRMDNINSSPLCGVTIDSSQLAQKILYYNFDGVTPCFSPSRTRAGQIKVELINGSLWSDVGAVLKLTYINFKITRMYDNKSIMFNGVKTLQNINGNNWLGFLLGTAKLKYRERALNIQVTFDNASAATWNSARITEWSYSPSLVRITFTAVGDTALNGFSNVDSWGINRFGQSFTTYYHAALLSNTYCGLWRFNNGELVHHVDNNDFTLTLGVDKDGNPSQLDCAYGYKVNWTNTNGKNLSVVLSY